MRHDFLCKTGVAVNNFIQGRVTEYGQPQQRKGKRNHQRTQNEFTDGTAARDTRQEQADERRPGNPPGPEKQRPAVHPLRWPVKGKGVQRHAHKAVDVVSHVKHQRIQQETGVACKQNKQNQAEREGDIQFRQNTDTFVHTGGHRNGGDNHR